MKYKMYDEMMEQPDSLKSTFESEFSKMEEVSNLIGDVDKVYLNWYITYAFTYTCR